MENCTIYSHQIAFDKVVEIVKQYLPKAKVDIEDGGKQKSLVATVKGGFFSKNKTLQINYRERENPSYKLERADCGLTKNLSGMVGYIQSLPANNPELRNKFLYKIMAANCEMAFIAEPNLAQPFSDVLSQIVQELDAFIFAQPNSFFNKAMGPHFVDKHFNLILDTSGNCNITDIDVTVDPKYHDQLKENYTEEQLERKEYSEAMLSSNNVRVNKNLPCVPASENTNIRSLSEVVDRAYALLAIAAKGEGIEQEHLELMVDSKGINSFSPKESIVYQSEVLNDQDKVYATWRYESLYTILWALGKMENLKYPKEICDVQAVVGTLIQPSREEFEKSARLRSTSEILDTLDHVYRMNWACVNARVNQEQVTGNLNPSVIYERHYSLNWLTQYHNQDWDDVQTDT